MELVRVVEALCEKNLLDEEARLWVARKHLG